MFFKKELLLDDIEPTMRLRKQSIFHYFDSVELKKTHYTLELIDNMKEEYKRKYFMDYMIIFPNLFYLHSVLII